MYGIYYEGVVPMKPEMKKKDFVSDDEFSYQMPKTYFWCAGEVYDQATAFTWSDDSLLVVKDNCVVKYSESKFHDVLVVDEEGKKGWLENREAELYGFTNENIEDNIERKRYVVEEYDLEKLEKRTYQVVLETISPMNDLDEYYIQKAINTNKEINNTEYMLIE